MDLAHKYAAGKMSDAQLQKYNEELQKKNIQPSE